LPSLILIYADSTSSPKPFIRCAPFFRENNHGNGHVKTRAFRGDILLKETLWKAETAEKK